MKKIILSGLVAGVVLLIFSIAGLYATLRFFPSIAEQYFDPEFATQSSRYMIFFWHPFVISMALSWFWSRYKDVLKGSFITRGIEFGLIYTVIAIVPMMLMIYSAMNVSLMLVLTWLVNGWLQGTISGLVFEKLNP